MAVILDFSENRVRHRANSSCAMPEKRLAGIPVESVAPAVVAGRRAARGRGGPGPRVAVARRRPAVHGERIVEAERPGLAVGRRPPARCRRVGRPDARPAAVVVARGTRDAHRSRRVQRAAVVHRQAPGIGRRVRRRLVDVHVRLTGQRNSPRCHHVVVEMIVEKVVDVAVRVMQPAARRRPVERRPSHRRQLSEPVQLDGAGHRERYGLYVARPAIGRSRRRIAAATGVPPIVLGTGARLRHVVSGPPIVLGRSARLRHVVSGTPPVLHRTVPRLRLHVVIAPPGALITARWLLHVVGAAPVQWNSPGRRSRPVLFPGRFGAARTRDRYPGANGLCGLQDALILEHRTRRRQSAAGFVVPRPTSGIGRPRVPAATALAGVAAAAIASGAAPRTEVIAMPRNRVVDALGRTRLYAESFGDRTRTEDDSRIRFVRHVRFRLDVLFIDRHFLVLCDANEIGILV